MKKCTSCQESFTDSYPLIIYLTESSGEISVYAQNNGCNMVIIKRILLCREWAGGGFTINYLREPDFIVGGENVEQGLTQLKYRASGLGAVSAQAKAEYFEITGHTLSCELNLSDMEERHV